MKVSPKSLPTVNCAQILFFFNPMEHKSLAFWSILSFRAESRNRLKPCSRNIHQGSFWRRWINTSVPLVLYRTRIRSLHSQLPESFNSLLKQKHYVSISHWNALKRLLKIAGSQAQPLKAQLLNLHSNKCSRSLGTQLSLWIACSDKTLGPHVLNLGCSNINKMNLFSYYARAHSWH